MEIEIIVDNKRLTAVGEVSKLKAILDVLMSMGHDEQKRTLTYLLARFNDQFTISDIEKTAAEEE